MFLKRNTLDKEKKKDRKNIKKKKKILNSFEFLVE